MKGIRTRWTIAVVLAVVVVTGVIVGCRRGTPETAAKTKVTICQWGQALIYLPLYIAQEHGYFADEGSESRMEAQMT